jgi:YVTN family beta-propeller protein
VGYDLGVDLGGTFVTAATADGPHPEVLELGGRSRAAAVVFRADDGGLLTGDDAVERGLARPDLLARGLKRRLGNPAPVRLAGASYPPAELLATCLRAAVAHAEQRNGGPPERLVLTRPEYWGAGRREAFDSVARMAGPVDPHVVGEPEAVAAHRADLGELADGDTIAVYDLGGSTFDATVLRQDGDRAHILGRPEGIEQLGGTNFDEAILAHVNSTAGGVLSGLDLRQPDNTAAVARLRRECVRAKEALSTETGTSIEAVLSGRRIAVQLSRDEFEDMIRTPVQTTVMALIRALESASVESGTLAAVVLVGGSARIPLVRRMISEALARSVVLDPEPEHAAALGAALLARTVAPAVPARPTVPEAAVPGPRRQQRLDQDLVAASVTTRAAEPARSLRTAPGRMPPTTGRDPHPAAEPGSLFEPYPADGAGYSDGGVDSAVTTAFPALLHPAAPTPTAPVDPFLGVSPNELRAGPTDRGPAALPPPSGPGTSRPRRRSPLLVVALVAVAALVAGVGYLVATRSPAAPLAQPPAAPAPGVAAAAPPASVARPVFVATVPVGSTPGFVAVAPDGRQAMVANQAAGTLTVLDTATNAVRATIPVPAGPPQYLTFSPDGRRVYVSIWDKARTVASVGVLDTAANTMITTIPVRTRPYLSAVTPDGRLLYVPNHDSGTISVIDTASNDVVGEIRVAPNPHWIEMSDDGRRAYVANHESNLVSVIDTADNSVVATVPVQTSPHSLAVHPSRPLVANVNYDAASVTMIDTNTNKVVAAVAVGRNPQDITWAPDGRHGYVVNTTDNTLSVIDAQTATVTATVPTGASPTSVAVLPNGTEAYVSNLDDGTLSVLDLDG